MHLRSHQALKQGSAAIVAARMAFEGSCCDIRLSSLSKGSHWQQKAARLSAHRFHVPRSQVYSTTCTTVRFVGSTKYTRSSE